MVILLICPFRACNTDFIAVHHDDVVAHVHVRRIFWLMLTAQAMGDLGGEPPKRLVFSIDDKPVVLDVIGLGTICSDRKSVV